MSEDDKLSKQIERAFLRDRRVSGHRIHVSVVDGTVILAGSVQSYRRKLAAQEIAASCEGCREVENQLAVVPPEFVSDESVATYTRAALESHADVSKATISVEVEGGIVTLGGTTRTPWERMVAYDVAMGVRGVREVRNHILVDPTEQVEDEAMSRRIANALLPIHGLKNVTIHVAVDGGHVVLSGEVKESWQKETAAEVAAEFEPLRITNDILVLGHPPTNPNG